MLSKEQVRKLKAAAHNLNPVVIIGHNELTEGVHKEIEVALNAHELIKIRVNALDKQHRQSMTQLICQQHQADLITIIGHIAIIYRQKKD